MRKIKEKIKCGEWGLNPQPLEWMRELEKKSVNKMWRVGIEPTTSRMDERVRRKIKEKINVESGD